MRRAPGAVRCLFLLAICDIALRTLGFGRTLRAAHYLAGHRAAEVDEKLIRDTLKSVVTATAFYPGRSKCLEQTMTSYVLLRRRGAAVRMRIGVQPYPFFAHAWLELNGVPVTETPEVVGRFALLPDIAV